MLIKYKKEILIGVSIFLLLVSLLFKSSNYTNLQNKSIEAGVELSKIEDIATMNKIWKQNTKQIPKKLESIKREAGDSKIEKFQLKKKKATIILKKLNGNQLNRIVGKYIASVPIQITRIAIDRDKENYRLEMECKW